MSIATRTTSIEGHIEDDYNALTRLGADLTNVDKNIENIASVVDDIYDKLPKVTGTGNDLSLTPTLKGGLNILPLGNAEQDGTPTPDNPIDIKVVTGDNQVVVSNKNLFDGILSAGYYVASTKTLTSTSSTIFKSFAIDLKAGNYTLSCNTNINIVRAFTDYNNSSDVIFSGTALNITSFTMNITQDTKLYLSVRRNDNTDWLSTDLLQLEVGSTATDYVAHQEQSTTLHLGTTELCKIGDYQDVITGTKDNWKVVRNIGKVVLSGGAGETYSLSAIYTDTVRISYTNVISNYVQSTILSNYFTYEATNNDIPHIRFNNMGNIFFYINKTNATDTNSFATWLSAHNTIVCYILAEPIEEPITSSTNPTLFADLNNMYDLLSYDGTTNITITSASNNAQMLVQVSALKGE